MSYLNTIEDTNILPNLDEEALPVQSSTSLDQELSTNSTLAASAPAPTTSVYYRNLYDAKRVEKTFANFSLKRQFLFIKHSKAIKYKGTEQLVIDFLKNLKEAPNNKIEKIIRIFQKKIDSNDDDKDFCAIKTHLFSRLGFWRRLKIEMENGPLSIAFYVALFATGAALNVYFK